MSKDDVPFFSIVIPVYNEENNIEYLYDSINRELEGLHYELIYVDDGSTDNSSTLVKNIVGKDKNAKGAILSRNFGHQAALKAGIDIAKGEFIITMDGDGQNPPGVIHSMIDKYQKGFDVVNTSRKSGKNEGIFKKLSSKLFYFTFNSISNYKIPKNSSDFRLMSREAIKSYCQLSERVRFNRGLSVWIGFRQTTIDFTPNERSYGKTKYSKKKMFSLGIDAITSFSSTPLRISFVLGLIITFLGVIYSIYAIIQFYNHQVIRGWTSIIILVLIIGGIQLISIGLIGEYLSKIFYETKNRPIYIIKEILE